MGTQGTRWLFVAATFAGAPACSPPPGQPVDAPPGVDGGARIDAAPPDARWEPPAFSPYQPMCFPALRDDYVMFLEGAHAGLDYAFANDDNNGTHNAPDLTHPVWSTGLLQPEIRTWPYRWGETVGEPGTTWVDIITTVRDRFATAGRPFHAYLLNLYPALGGPYPADPALAHDKTLQPLLAHPGDFFASDGLSPEIFGNRAAPWFQHGIDFQRPIWQADFAAIRAQFDAAGLTAPGAPRLEGLSSAMENFDHGFAVDHYALDTPTDPGQIAVGQPGRQGWSTRALALPEADTILFNGEQTWRQWTQTVRQRDGSPLPAPDYSQYQGYLMGETPNLFAALSPYYEARIGARNWALFAGYAEPFFDAFDSAFDDLAFFGYTISGTGSAEHGVAVAPGASANDDAVRFGPGQPYRLRGHALDWYGEGVGGPIFMRTFSSPGGGATPGDLADPTGDRRHNNIWDWMVWIESKWPSPGTAPFDDARPVVDIIPFQVDRDHPLAQTITVGQYHWAMAVRFLLAIYDLRVAHPTDHLAPWVTLHYLRDAREREIWKWVHLRLIDLGVRRGILFAGNTNFSVHYPSGIGTSQADLLAEALPELEARRTSGPCAP